MCRGGRRNDLETLRRAIPLLRSDYIIEPVETSATRTGSRCGCRTTARGPVRWTHTSFARALYAVQRLLRHGRKDADYDLARRILGQWREFADCLRRLLSADRLSWDNDVWMAWQSTCPSRGGASCSASAVRTALRVGAAATELQVPEATYAFTDKVRANTRARPAANDGRRLAITRDPRPSALVVTYWKE